MAKKNKGSAKAPQVTTAPKNKGGRPSKYTPELIALICERLSTGETMNSICRDAGMPHPATVLDWVAAKTEVSLAIAKARRVGHDALAEECVAIADTKARSTQNGDVDSGDIAHKKLRVWTRLQLLSKWDPKRYGNNLDVTSGGEKLSTPPINILPQ